MLSLLELNALETHRFVEAVSPLFEGAPRFLLRLAGQRPFSSDEELFEAARATARVMPSDEQVELLDAHPRIGADPASVSVLSHAEQGYDADGTDGTDQRAWVADELRALNEAYEARFGFRFVVFVAGRPHEEILPLLERAVLAEPDEELRRGLDDVVLIAADRLGSLRGPAPMAEELREAVALEVSRHLVGELDAAGLIRASRRLVDDGVESSALLALSLADHDDSDGVGDAIARLMHAIGLDEWTEGQAGQLLALHAAASILGLVSRPIDGARRIVAAADHATLRELIARWEESPAERDDIDALITREASDLFEEGATTR